MVKKQIIKTLEHEIKWCESQSKNRQMEIGFIKGLKQAIYLIDQLELLNKSK